MNKSKRKFGPRKKAKNEKPLLRKIEGKLGMIAPFEHIEIGRNMKWVPLKVPKGPKPGAVFTTRQFAATFLSSAGLTNVGGSSGAAQLVQNGATAVNFAIGFELQDLTQVSTFSSLFDQYRWERVKVHGKARSNAISVFNTAAPNSAVPSGFIVVDRDDISAPAGITDCMQYDNAQAVNGAEDWTVDLVPSVTPALYSTGAFSGYSTVPGDSLWLDIANTGIPAYGVKGSIGPLTATTSSSWVWDLSAEYVISFRKVR